MAYTFIEDCLYWKDPSKTMLMLNGLLLVPVMIWLVIPAIPYLPIRHIVAVGIWLPALINSDFVLSNLSYFTK